MVPTNPSANPKFPAIRLGSIDAYRGFVMLLMMGEVLSFREVSDAFPQSGFWRILAYHQSHVEWVGCSLHDLIQPSFSFLVGVALPFSMASRLGRGQSQRSMTLHAAWRSILLILLGVFLRSIGRPQTYWTFEDTLTQIGLGYFFLYLLGRRGARTQWAAFFLILIGYWLAFAANPLPGNGFNYERVGVPSGWPHLLPGFAAHWNKNSNLAWRFDTWFLNLFPREHPFLFNEGGYATLSFIPTLATMILGCLAGETLRAQKDSHQKITWLCWTGLACFSAGLLADWLGICPVVKRIWTPSWVLFSGGCCCWLMAGFYFLIDVRRWQAWAFPLKVVGLNSIAAYCMAHLWGDFVTQSWKTHLGRDPFLMLGPAYEPFLLGFVTLGTFWLILFWMRQQKIFLRI